MRKKYFQELQTFQPVLLEIFLGLYYKSPLAISTAL